MKKLFQIFGWGLLISFLGTLPMGTLNVVAMQIAVQESILQAFYYSLGCIVVEVIYVRLSLVGISWIRKQEKIMKVMEWITLGILIALAAGSFWAATQSDGVGKSAFLNNNMHRFFLGMMMSALNPVQIPFWFGWSAVLFSKKILEPKNSNYNFYIVGIGLGTLVGHSLFILGGNWIVSKISNSEQYINWVIGGIFSITAIIQLIRILKGKGISSKMKNIEGKELK